MITPPDTRSTVVPGLASCEAAGTDFRVLSGNFTSEACPAVAACSNQKAKWQSCTTCSSSAFETYLSKSCQSGLWDAGIFPTSWILQPLRFPYTKVKEINKCICKSPFVICIFKAIRPCFQNNWVKVSLNVMEYFCGLCVCDKIICVHICEHVHMHVHMKRLQEAFRCSALLIFAHFLETGSLTYPRLVARWFSSICPLKHWGYVSMAAPNVRKNFNYYYLEWGQLCTRQLVLSFHLSMGYDDWTGGYTKCLYLFLHGYLGIWTRVFLLECSYQPFQPHKEDSNRKN